MTSGIYTITNILDNKIYLGCTFNLRDRLQHHKNDLIRGVHANIHLQRAWNRDGEENFLFEILDYCLEEYLYSEEHYWAYVLAVHNSNFGYNLRPTRPDGKAGCAEETRNKIRKTLLETYSKYEIHPNVGFKHSRESKIKMSMSQMNKTRGIESIQKGIETRKNNKKAWHSEETKEKMSKSKLGKKRPNYTSKIQKPVLQLDINGRIVREWASIAEACKELNIKSSTLFQAIKRKSFTKTGNFWRYK